MINILSILTIYISNIIFALSIAFLIYNARSKIKKYFANSTNLNIHKKHSYDDPLIIAIIVAGISMSCLIIIGTNLIFSLLFSAIAAAITPKMLQKSKQAKFEKEFDRSLIESLTTIGASLKAGLTLKDSLEIAARNCPPIFAQEAKLVLKEYQFGLGLEEALDNLRKRVNTPNVNIAIGALIIGHQLGGNIPIILQNIVATLRERERVEGKLKSLTAQGRTQAMMLFAAPPVLGIGMYLWDSHKFSLLTSTFPGQVLLCIAVILEVIGILATKRALKFDV